MKRFTKFIAAILAATAITVSATTKSASASADQTAQDSQFLNTIGYSPDRNGETYTYFHWGEVSKMVDKAWAKAGITSVTSWEGVNRYWLDGKEISRKEAFFYAAGHPVDLNKYSPRSVLFNTFADFSGE